MLSLIFFLPLVEDVLLLIEPVVLDFLALFSYSDDYSEPLGHKIYPFFFSFSFSFFSF